jgi:hypothetical protein
MSRSRILATFGLLCAVALATLSVPQVRIVREFGDYGADWHGTGAGLVFWRTCEDLCGGSPYNRK